MTALPPDMKIRSLEYALALVSDRARDLEAHAQNLMAELGRRPTLVAVDNAKKLTADDVRRIRADWRTTGFTQREIARNYGVNPATVSRIVRGRYHADVR